MSGPDSIGAMLSCRSLAVVGASDKPGLGRNVMSNALRMNDGMALYPVNPKYSQVAGRPCVGSVDDLAHPFDVAALAIPPAAVVGTAQRCIDHGARGIVVMSAGVSGPAVNEVEQAAALRELSGRHGVPIVGPNCIGFLSTADRVAVWGGSTLGNVRPGGISVVSQSGAPVIAMVTDRRALGCRLVINTGNEVGVDVAQAVEFCVADPGTTVVACYLEELRDPDRFLHAARRAAGAGTPIVVLKGGRTERGSRAAASHTASVAGDPAIYDAFFAEAGVLVVDDLDELVETVALFAQIGTAAGPRVAIMTGSGGLRVMAEDAMMTLGLQLPEFSPATAARLRRALPRGVEVANPLDITAQGLASFDIHHGCAEALADSAEVDTMVAHLIVPHRGLAGTVGAAASAAGKPAVFVLANAAQVWDDEFGETVLGAGCGLVQGAATGLRALANVVNYGTGSGTEAGPAPGRADGPRVPAIGSLLPAGQRVLLEPEAHAVLAAFGIGVPAEAVATTAREAVRHARAIGYPVVMKVQSREVLHKSDIGGVRVGVRDDTEAAHTFDELLARAGAARPDAEFAGVLVQELARPGVEVLLGMTRDPRFGPVVVFGAGGVHVELYHDVVLRRPPITPATAESMIRSIRANPVLTGARGSAPVDLTCLRDALVGFGEAALALGPRVQQFEINPFIVGPWGGLAVDALVVLDPVEGNSNG